MEPEPDARGARPDPAPAASAPVRRRGGIPRALLDPAALSVVYRLQRSGHEAYLVGGCVRDLLAGHEPKDFDVATDARPQRIRQLFRNARIIGRRFRLAHVYFPGPHVIETSTFRADPTPPPEEVEVPGEEGPEADLPEAEPALSSADRRWPEENVFGTAPEDARRRDFTLNALFYDPSKDELIDWVGGLADLEARVVRSIGDPRVRLVEDPVRMIRAVHCAERMGFTIEPSLEAAMRDLAGEIGRASPSRLYVELLKVLHRGAARPTLHRLHDLGVLEHWIPELCRHLGREAPWPTDAGSREEAGRGEPERTSVAHATWNLLGAADRWGLASRRASDALALATLVGPWLLETWEETGRRGFPGFLDHMDRVWRPLAVRMSVPKRVSFRIAEILAMLQDLRHPPHPRRAARMVRRPGFEEALAFFTLDLMARDGDLALAEEWEARARGRERPAPEARPERAPLGEPQPRGPRRGRRRRRRGGSFAVEPEADAWSPPPPDAPPADTGFAQGLDSP